jgi:hypothetical protein
LHVGTAKSRGFSEVSPSVPKFPCNTDATRRSLSVSFDSVGEDASFWQRTQPSSLPFASSTMVEPTAGLGDGVGNYGIIAKPDILDFVNLPGPAGAAPA